MAQYSPLLRNAHKYCAKIICKASQTVMAVTTKSASAPAHCMANANVAKLETLARTHDIIDTVQLINLWPILLMVHSDERQAKIITHSGAV